MKNKIRGILSIVIFFVGFVYYLGYIFIWMDNNTTYTLYNCTDSQKEFIGKEINVDFPDDAVIDEIIYYWTWGNDTPRFFSIKMHLNAKDYKKLVLKDSEYLQVKEIQYNNESYNLQLNYVADKYVDLVGWMTENGKENIKYKRRVAMNYFLILIIISLIPIIPYKKYLKKLNVISKKKIE